MNCPKCRKIVPQGLHGIRLECGHSMHTKCLDKLNPDFAQCSACKGEVDLSVPLVDANEPTTYNGRDYVLDPLPKASDSLFSRLRGARTAEPWIWLAEHKPIEWMIQNHGYGLQRMLASGVGMGDFLGNGYTWEELKTFRDLASGQKERAREALFALQTNAEHFRDHLKPAIAELEINGRHLVEMYGFIFEPNCPLAVIGGKNDRPWSASELVQLGMKMGDLFGAGLESIEQYADLEPTDQNEVEMGVTDADVGGLVRKLAQVPAPAPVLAPVSAPAPAPAYTSRVPVAMDYVRPKITRLHGLKK